VTEWGYVIYDVNGAYLTRASGRVYWQENESQAAFFLTRSSADKAAQKQSAYEGTRAKNFTVAEAKRTYTVELT
jgi:hypothetical protein